MIALRSNRTPTLAVAARVAAAERAAARRQASPARRWLRRGMMFVAILFGMLAFLGGVGATPAQAGLVDDFNNKIADLSNWCDPENIKVATVYGVDMSFGLNMPKDDADAARYAQLRKTVKPTKIVQNDSAYKRLQALYPPGGDNDLVIHPSYERYGFTALEWTNYQSGCGISLGASSIASGIFEFLVKWPTMATMAGVKIALDNVLYDIFALLISPWIAAFTAIFKPWVAAIIIPVGLPLVWAKTRGSISKTLSAALWIGFCMGILLWLPNNTTKVVATANTFVADFTSNAACEMIKAGVNNQVGTFSPGNCAGGGSDGLNNALWRGIPYNTWMFGEVGDFQARADRAAEANNQIGWSQAILNGLYVGNDPAGVQITADAYAWNNAGYGIGDGTKTELWTEFDQWEKVPFLTVVKFMCNDTEEANDKKGNADDENNRWMKSTCDTSGGTSEWIDNFRGERYNQRLAAAFTGGIAAFTVLFALGFAALFVAYQKMMFFWILLWAPLWLVIGMFPTRRDFVIRYGERAVGVIIYQCVGVLVVLFVSNSMAVLLYPTPGSGVPEVPWALKPFAAIIYFWTMITLYFPARKIGKAVTRNDTEIVNKSVDAPKTAAKWTAKAAVVATAAVATGGTSLGAAAIKGGTAGKLATGLAEHGGKVGGLLGKGIQFADFAHKTRDIFKGDGYDPASTTGKGRIAALAKTFADHYKTTRRHHPLDPANPSNKDVDPNLLYAGMLRTAKEQAFNFLNSPQFTDGTEIKAKVDLASADIMRRLLHDPNNPHRTLTKQDVAALLQQNPRVLSAEYHQPGQMDPRHPATAALLRLEFTPASATEWREVFQEAVDAVGTYGLPDKISELYSVGDTAQDFSEISLLGVMRHRSPQLDMDERLADLAAFTAAAASIPRDHPAFDAVNDYRTALASPMMSDDVVNGLGRRVFDALMTENPQLHFFPR
ncbi:hypothetical protein AB0H83_36170 [Dactylosporangium sp. NPDC050688]|uniref:hypothetical protein n=1 Tax=Dactylosporangium sp. NPDC050688 TaxID=3157217 RepID=UPI003406CC33